MATSFLQRGGSLFNIDPGASPEAAARKREILTAMLAGQRKPKYIGEGILDGVSRAIAGWQMGKLDRAEGEKRDAASKAFQGILGGVPAPQGPLTITGIDPSWGTPAALVEPSAPGYGITPGAANGAAGPELRQPFASGAYGLPGSLVQSESGGKWSALNAEGYGGRGQFGADRLADAARAGVIPAGMTGADYAKAPPEVQLAVENWHRDDVLRDLGQYVGVDPDGPGPIPPLTPDSLLAVAHLGGKGGAKRFVDTGGRYNPSDSNGTSLADYAIRHAGGEQGSSMSVPSIPAYSGPPIADLQAAVTNPWLSAEERQMAASLLDRAMQQGDPAYQLQMAQGQLGLQKTQMEIAKMGQPDIPASFQTLDLQAQAAGLVPGTPEYQQFMLAGGTGGGAASRVQSSEILDDGTIVTVMSDGTPRVVSPSGDVLTGQAAADAVRSARAYGVENQREIYGGRREGTLGADIALGGHAQAVTDIASATVEAGMSAWQDYGKLQSSLGNINEAIAALDNGAKAGMVYNMLPSVTEASASLENAMNRMGLDVIGSVTFGALSEGEMRLAMDTAVPRNLGPAELRSWLERKRDAQQKAATMLADAAQYLTVPGNTINGWIEKNRAAKQPSGPTAPGAPQVQTYTFNPETGELE